MAAALAVIMISRCIATLLFFIVSFFIARRDAYYFAG
jgi:hypothetical protein